jgi:hypothetical protein
VRPTPYPPITPQDIDFIDDPLERARTAGAAADTLSTYARVFSALRRDAVRGLADTGWSYAQIADSLSVSKSMIQKIISRDVIPADKLDVPNERILFEFRPTKGMKFTVESHGGIRYSDIPDRRVRAFVGKFRYRYRWQNGDLGDWTDWQDAPIP